MKPRLPYNRDKNDKPIVSDYRELKTADNLLIVGKGLTSPEAFQLSCDWHVDVWGLNEMDWPTMTAVFDVHCPDLVATTHDVAARDIPVVMLYPDHSAGPHVVAYPREEMEVCGWPQYYSSTPAYMIALAIWLGYKSVGLYGIDYLAEIPEAFTRQLRATKPEDEFRKAYRELRNYIRREGIYERPGTEFWIGFATAKDVHVRFPKFSSLLMTGPGTRKAYGDWTPDEGEEFVRSARNIGDRMFADPEADLAEAMKFPGPAETQATDDGESDE